MDRIDDGTMQALSQFHSHDVSSQKCLQAEMLGELFIE